MKYEQLYKSEGLGGRFDFGIELNVAGPHIGSTEVKRAARQAAELIEQAVTREFYANDKDAQESARLEKLELLNCFPLKPIFAKSISNEYCSRACCEHRPWFLVTSTIGEIKVGQRKRVIVIDWSNSIVTTTAEDLFPGEDVTKIASSIHAWSYDKARIYIEKLFQKAG